MKGIIISFLVVIALLEVPQVEVAGQNAGTAVRIKLATTTSTENSGLLDVLLPAFEERYGIKVDVIAAGTGKALKLGENGDVDVVLVHAPEAEEAFVEAGHGVERHDLMYNDFVIVGPSADPAKVRGMKDAAAALRKIAEAQAPFISRGDDSGTHKKERALWLDAGVDPRGRWYLEGGQAMGPTLRVTDEKNGYTLVDRGTYIAYSGKIESVILCEGDPKLHNPYGIIAVSSTRHPHVKYAEAMTLIRWMTSQEGQRMIGDFEKGRQTLFHPLALPKPGDK